MNAERRLRTLVPVVVLVAAAGCGSSARLPVSAGIGRQPTLPKPEKSLIPIVNVVDAKGWPANATPTAAEGTVVTAFARGLDHPRWMPNGAPVDVSMGFVNDDGNAWGRPVGVAIDRRGALLVADDVGNTVWRVTARPTP